MRRKEAIRVTIGAGIAALAGCASSPSGSIRFEPEPRAIAPAAVGPPAFAFGSGGDLQLLAATSHGSGTQLRAFVSRDGGDTFADRGFVSPPSSNVEFSGENRPRFVMDRNELLYAVWREDAPSGRILVATHDWRTPGFAMPVPVRDVASPAFSGFADMAVAPNGDVGVVWLDERDKPASSDASAVYFAKSTDGGRSFGKNVLVAAHTCGCCRPTIVVDGDGRIYVAWRHDFDDVRDMAVASSADGGKTFSTPVRISKDGWSIHGCPESGPSLLAAGGRLYASWFTVGADSRPRVLASWSDDRGRSFTSPVDLSAGVLDANHPMLFAGKPDGVWAVFEGRDPGSKAGWSPFRIYLIRVDRPGTRAIALVDSSTDQEYPFAVMRDAQSLFVGVSSAGRAALLRGRIEQ